MSGLSTFMQIFNWPRSIIWCVHGAIIERGGRAAQISQFAIFFSILLAHAAISRLGIPLKRLFLYLLWHCQCLELNENSVRSRLVSYDLCRVPSTAPQC